MDISYSDGRVVKNAVICIWDDLNNPRPGFYRAYWCATPDADTGSPVIGLTSAGGSHHTVKAAAREALKLHPGATCYRNGKPVHMVGWLSP